MPANSNPVKNCTVRSRFVAALRLGASLLLIAFAALAADDAALNSAIEKLDHADFDVREKGAAELRAALCAGDEEKVRAALQQRLKNGPSAELKNQAERILALCQGGPIVNGLRARLSVATNDKGEVELTAPFKELPKLTLRITNVGNETVQVPQSSYPNYHFFKLKVVPLDEQGKPGEELPAHWDLYPTNDMTAPHLLYTTLKPGEKTEREMTLQLREGYLLQKVLRAFPAAFQEYKGKGIARLREPGLYQLSGVYVTGAEKTAVFESPQGRVENLPLWSGKVEAPGFKLRVSK